MKRSNDDLYDKLNIYEGEARKNVREIGELQG